MDPRLCAAQRLCVGAVGLKIAWVFRVSGLARHAHAAQAALISSEARSTVLLSAVHVASKVVRSGAMLQIARYFLESEAVHQEVNRHAHFYAPSCCKRACSIKGCAGEATLA